jgi:hypothetical protein
MHNYAGNPAVYPANIGLVDDADLNPATASALDVAPTNLADRTAWLHANAILVTGGVITGDLEFTSGSFLTVDFGAFEQVFGELEIMSGGLVNFDSGSLLSGTAGGGLTYTGTLQIEGLLEIKSGGALTIDVGASFVIPAFPDFIAPITDARVRSFREAATADGAGLWTSDQAGIKNQSVSPPLTTASWIVLDLPTHNGARLDSITVTFAVGQDHAGKPDASGGHFPRFLVKRLAHGGAYALDDLIAAGFVEIPGSGYADGHAWYAGGANQTFTVTINQNNTIDTSAYSYHIMVQDELGPNGLSLNIYRSIRCNYSNINSSQWA